MRREAKFRPSPGDCDTQNIALVQVEDTRTVAAIVGPVGVGGHASDTSEESLLPSLALPRHHLTHGESHIMKQDLAVQQINSRVPDSNNISLGLQTSPTLKGRLPHHLCHIRVLLGGDIDGDKVQN